MNLGLVLKAEEAYKAHTKDEDGYALELNRLINQAGLRQPFRTEPARDRAFGEAGLTVSDVDTAQLYDPFTISTLMQLEQYGFCKPGEGGPFVAAGETGPGGSIPTNTGGDQLSGWYATGFTPLTEAIRQLRGEGEATQIPDAEVALVSGHGGNGGVQNTWMHGTALLGRAPAVTACSIERVRVRVRVRVRIRVSPL